MTPSVAAVSSDAAAALAAAAADVEEPPPPADVASGVPVLRRCVARAAASVSLAARRVWAMVAPPRPATAAAEGAAPPHAAVIISGSSVDEPDPIADPRLPFDAAAPQGGAGTASAHHLVDLPPSIDATATVLSVRFEVEDDGVGLSPEQRRRLFKPYSQARATT